MEGQEILASGNLGNRHHVDLRVGLHAFPGTLRSKHGSESKVSGTSYPVYNLNYVLGETVSDKIKSQNKKKPNNSNTRYK